ncbi:MAG: L,D-transpeptidase family protein, partial [Ilumatobacteraceae bacterium]
TERSVRVGDSGASVRCVQQALIAAKLLSGTPSGTFDSATDTAIRKLQQTHDLFVDGVVGRESAIQLGVWPNEESLVVRTPRPAKGAKDLLGYPLSPVATSGPDTPPLPDGSGSGKRMVYSRAGQRIWAVDKNNRVIRSWLVSGSKYSNETPGVHKVYSRSETSTAWNGKALLPHMVRWLKTDIGNIGFHGIPVHVSDGSPYQTDAELGSRLSGGCQRQDNLDANFVWDFAQIGTPIVVL